MIAVRCAGKSWCLDGFATQVHAHKILGSPCWRSELESTRISARLLLALGQASCTIKPSHVSLRCVAGCRECCRRTSFLPLIPGPVSAPRISTPTAFLKSILCSCVPVLRTVGQSRVAALTRRWRSAARRGIRCSLPQSLSDGSLGDSR